MRKADERCGAVFRRLVVSKLQRTDYSNRALEWNLCGYFALQNIDNEFKMEFWREFFCCNYALLLQRAKKKGA